MRNYELIYVIRPDLTDQDVASIQAEVRTRIEALNGTIEKEHAWGRRQLAFEIRDFTEGVYTFDEVAFPEDSPGKLIDQLKIDERIIRYMLTVKQPKRKPKPEAKAEPESSEVESTEE